MVSFSFLFIHNSGQESCVRGSSTSIAESGGCTATDEVTNGSGTCLMASVTRD